MGGNKWRLRTGSLRAAFNRARVTFIESGIRRATREKGGADSDDENKKECVKFHWFNECNQF